MSSNWIVNTIESNDIAIFGAQATACGIARTLFDVYEKKPTAIIVSKLDGNPNEIYGIWVHTLDSIAISKDMLIIVSTPHTTHKEIVELLSNRGFYNVLLVDSKTEYEIMSDYFRKTGMFALLEDFPLGSYEPNVQIYRVSSQKDLMTVISEPRKNTIDILAGAFLSNDTDSSSKGIRDNTGENISHKNRNYCELTATYWIWKNVISEYKGICHYRRYLRLNGDDYKKLCNVDVVLPIPFINYPNAGSHFSRYNNDSVLKVVLEVLKNRHLVYYLASEWYFSQEYTYNYNMLIAKSDVFDRYCEFIFDVLFEVEKAVAENNIDHNLRYIGYIGEALTSLYFMVNAEKLKIIHAPRILQI